MRLGEAVQETLNKAVSGDSEKSRAVCKASNISLNRDAHPRFLVLRKYRTRTNVDLCVRQPMTHTFHSH